MQDNLNRKRQVVKTGIHPYGKGDGRNEGALKDFLENNYAIYGWTQSSGYLNMGKGALLVIHSGNLITHIGEVLIPPHNWVLYNPNNASEFLKKFESKRKEEDAYLENEKKWVMTHVKKWFDIRHEEITHGGQAGATPIATTNEVDKINEIYISIIKNLSY